MLARWRALCAAGQMLCLAGEEVVEQCTASLVNAALSYAKLPPPPEIVCLCGSTKYLAAFLDWQRILTLEGVIVVTIGCVLRGDELMDSEGGDSAQKLKVDLLHRRKIDMADRVLVLDVDGYIGSSTKDEIQYAEETGKMVTMLSKVYPDYRPPDLPAALSRTYSIETGVRFSEERGCHMSYTEVNRG